MSYNKGNAKYYEGESSKIKPYLFNTRVLVRPLVTSYVATLPTQAEFEVK